jgi:hypothetical protein
MLHTGYQKISVKAAIVVRMSPMTFMVEKGCTDLVVYGNTPAYVYITVSSNGGRQHCAKFKLQNSLVTWSWTILACTLTGQARLSGQKSRPGVPISND